MFGDKDAKFSSPLREKEEKRRKRRGRLDRRTRRDGGEEGYPAGGKKKKYRKDIPCQFLKYQGNRNREEGFFKERSGGQETHTVQNGTKGETYKEGEKPESLYRKRDISE